MIAAPWRSPSGAGKAGSSQQSSLPCNQILCGTSGRGLSCPDANIEMRGHDVAKDVRTAASSWGVTGTAYERFSEDFGDALYHCTQRLDPQVGETVLDVATGTGWTARLAVARGAHVTGVDFSEDLVSAAREIAERYGLTIALDVGHAHDLPYATGSFDAVISTFGVIFASRAEVAAGELARGCRPGGRLALAVWTSDSTIALLARDVFSRFSPPPSHPPPPSPFAWGAEARMRELLGSNFELQFERGRTTLRAPDGEAVWRLWKEAHGLTVTRLDELDASLREAFRDAFIAFHERYRGDAGISMPRDYIVAIGTRQ